MVEKEIQTFFIVNNIIRLLILDSDRTQTESEKSFKSSAQLLLAHSESGIGKEHLDPKIILNELLQNIAECELLKRPNRVEPRVVKRRPKPYKMMMKSRAELKEELYRQAA